MKPKTAKSTSAKAFSCILALLCAIFSTTSSNAANIIFVSFHAGDDTPSGAAATAGFTRAPDVGYTELLRNHGHTVTRYLTRDIPEAAVLNAADLVIISRSVPSGNYELDAETAAWNGITAPMIILGGYVLRNTRLGFTTGATIPDVSSPSVRLTVNNPAHPIFAGIALDGANTMVNPYAHGVSYTGTVQRGISVNTDPVAGGGTILARVGTAGDAAFGGMIVGEWNAGAVMGTSPADTLGGKRLVVLTGSRENAAITGGAAGLTSEAAGIYDLDPDGAQILLNAVDYLVPPVPSTYRDVVMADGPIVYYSFSDLDTTAINSGSAGAAANGTYMNGAVSGAEAPRPPQYVGFPADNVALQLDGVDDFVQGPQRLLNTYSNVTLSGWIRRAGVQRGRTGLFGQDNVIEFGYIDNGTLQAWVDDFQTPINVATPFPDLEWDHVALVVNGDALQMTTYTNGVAAGSAPLPGNFYDSLDSMAFLVVGGDAFGNGVSFNGQIDEAAVFDKALTAEQIANHYFSAVAVPPSITLQPVGVTIFEGQTLQLSVGAVGTPQLRYQWLYFNSPIAGQTGPTLVISNALPEQSGIYSVEVRNAYGTNTSAEVEVIVNPTQPPIITAQPQSITRYAGRTATFTVVATGGATLTYQWQKGTTDIPSATSATLTLNNVSASDVADYRVIVSSSSGSTTSAAAHLTVITPVANSYEAAVVGGNPIAYWRLGEQSGSVAVDAWGGNDGTYSNVVLGAAGAIQGDADTAADFTGNSAVLTPLSLNSTPAFTALGWINRSGDQANRTGLWGQNDKVEFGYIDNNTIQLWTDNALNISPNPYPNGEWGFLAIVSDGPTASLYTNGILAGSRAQTLPANNNNLFNIGGGGIFDVVTANGNYFLGRIDEVAVYNRALSAQEVASLYFTGSGAAPIIITQPQGTNFFEGGTLTLCVTAAGAPPLSYKWLFFGTEIPGQTGPCLTIPNATPADSGNYQVEVSSPSGTTLSAEAVVDVRPANPPIITQDPQSATRYAGGSVTFTGAATGSQPITYQWQRNGSDVSGANSATLTLNNVQAANAGDYRLIAANALGRATSAVATLTVITPPAGSYEAAVVAGGPIAYWRLGESSGTTAFDYVGGNNGTYHDVTLGVPGAIPGDPNTAAGFNGTSSYVGTPLSLNGLTSLTMVGWIQRNTTQNNRTGLFGQNDVVEFGYIDNNTIQAWVDNFDAHVDVTPNPIPDQQWALVALTLNNGALAVQVNAGVDGTVTLPSSNYGTSADLFNIGGGGIFDTITANGNWFNGLIDEVAVYNRALTTAELDALYALGTAATNQCPTAGDVTVSVPQGGQVTVQVVYSDPDGDPMVGLSITQQPAHGVLAPGASINEVRYTPNAGYCGPDSFRYVVTDGQCTSAPATVNVTVVCSTNRCPVANSASVTVNSNATVNFTLTASDPENDPVQFTVTQPPAHGVVVVNAQTGAATYTPAAGYCGPDSFRFRATDALCGASADATISITVNCGGNQPPTGCTAAVIPEECAMVAADGTVSVISVNGTDACVVLQGSATDSEGQPLQFSWWTNGSVFALGPIATNCFALGCHSVTFVATDPNEANCTKTLNVCVITASEAVEECIELVEGADVARKNLRPLVASLKAAGASFERGNFTSGLNQLKAFENKVRAQIARDNPDEAAAFIECAQRITQALGCGVLAGE
jgi:hypothetical protein